MPCSLKVTIKHIGGKKLEKIHAESQNKKNYLSTWDKSITRIVMCWKKEG
jgi:hypothetical protein